MPYTGWSPAVAGDDGCDGTGLASHVSEEICCGCRKVIYSTTSDSCIYWEVMNVLKFDPFFRDVDRLAQQLWGAAVGGGGRSSMAPMDAWCDGDTIVIELDLPGITPDSLDVNVEHDALTVRAERVEPA